MFNKQIKLTLCVCVFRIIYFVVYNNKDNNKFNTFIDTTRGSIYKYMHDPTNTVMTQLVIAVVQFENL